MTRNIVITGCAGFIGSHVTEYFLKDQNYNVFGIDKLTYAGNLDNILHLINESKFTFIEQDICDRNAMQKICKDNDISWIINLAAETHVDNSIEDCTDFLKTNIEGVHNLLRICQELNIKLLHFSTDEVYGPKLLGKSTEEDSLKPKNPYAATKAAADHLIKSFENTYQIKSIIVRPSNNFGPNQHPEKLLPKTIKCIKENKKVSIYGKGQQMREWTYVEDTAMATKYILENANLGEVFNISSNTELRNIDLIQGVTLKMQVDFDENVKFVKDRPGHDFRYSVDSSKLKNIGFDNYTSIAKGLEIILGYVGVKNN